MTALMLRAPTTLLLMPLSFYAAFASADSPVPSGRSIPVFSIAKSQNKSKYPPAKPGALGL